MAARPNIFQSTLKVVQLNAENLFLFLDEAPPKDWSLLSEKDWQKLSKAQTPNKALGKTLWLAEALKEIDADVVFLNEVGGLESASNFARHFLADQYTPHLLEGNSDRGIDIGFLVHKRFPYRVELRTHKDRPLNFSYPHDPGKTLYFSRDCAELRILGPDQQVGLICLLVHLKSKLDPENIDPQGLQRRTAELKTLMTIYGELRAEFPQVPIIVGGDFNGQACKAKRGEEFQALDQSDLVSVMDLVERDEQAAATQVVFSRNGNLQTLQIDYLFISPELSQHLIVESVEVYRYRSDLKVALPLPQTLDQRLRLPSDHYPVVATFRNFLPVP